MTRGPEKGMGIEYSCRDSSQVPTVELGVYP